MFPFCNLKPISVVDKSYFSLCIMDKHQSITMYCRYQQKTILHPQDKCLAFISSLITRNSAIKPNDSFFYLDFNTVSSAGGEIELSSIWVILNFKDNFIYHVKT